MIIKDIDINKINFKDNIREDKADKDLSHLMQSIKDNGLLQPIGVKEIDKNTYIVLWGNRRLKAFKKLGYKTIPAAIFRDKKEELSEEEFLIINSIENLHRKSNTLLELGRVCSKLKKYMSESEIAVRLGIPKTRVKLALMEFKRIPKKYHNKIKIMDNTKTKGGNIPLSTASLIFSMRNLTNMQKDILLDYVTRNDISIRKIYLIASLMHDGKTLKQAIDISDNYKIVEASIYIKKDIYKKEIIDKDKNVRDFIAEMINKTYPDSTIGNVRRY